MSKVASQEHIQQVAHALQLELRYRIQVPVRESYWGRKHQGKDFGSRFTLIDGKFQHQCSNSPKCFKELCSAALSMKHAGRLLQFWGLFSCMCWGFYKPTYRAKSDLAWKILDHLIDSQFCRWLPTSFEYCDDTRPHDYSCRFYMNTTRVNNTNWN